MKKIFAVIILVAMVFFAGCANNAIQDTSGSVPKELNIFAAASLKEVLSELKPVFEKQYPGTTLNYNFASSGVLMEQIEQGAPADVFISAGKKQTDDLLKKGLINTTRNVAGNSLVLIIPVNEKIGFSALNDLVKPEYQKIAIGNPETVPAGKYAKEALEKAGIWKDILPRLIFAKDVRQVLFYVESGNVDAGLVYHSDVLVSKKVKNAITIPKEYYTKITYPAAVVKASANTGLANDFLNFLLSKEAQQTFKTYGFN